MKYFTMLTLLVACSLPALADFTQIPSPTADYLGATTYIDPSAIPDNTVNVTSITDGILTVTMDTPLEKFTVGFGLGWGTWNAAPNSQFAPGDPNIPVLWTQTTNSLTMTLSTGESIFGFEAEPDNNIHNMTATFYDGGTMVGTINQTVDSNAGSLLFAGSSTTDVFTSVTITSDSILDQGDFAIAGVRYGNVPEPSSLMLLGCGLAGLAAFARKRLA